MSPQEAHAETAYTLAWKIFFTSVAGGVTFVISSLINDAPVTVQLLFTVIVGGITLLVQFLVDFEKRMNSLEEAQSANIRAARAVIDRGFGRISEATRIFDVLQSSAIPAEALTNLVQHLGGFEGDIPVLRRELATHEIEKLANLLRRLGEGNEVSYKGEDREWLLGLTVKAQVSIDATSLATIDAGGAGFEGGIWKNDLGGRYLAHQRDAVLRGVKIRRIFVFDRPEFKTDRDFVGIRTVQNDYGIEVRVLESSMVPGHLMSMISDFVLFDREIMYETTPATQMDNRIKPAILNTRLVLEQETVLELANRFEELWQVAQPVT